MNRVSFLPSSKSLAFVEALKTVNTRRHGASVHGRCRLKTAVVGRIAWTGLILLNPSTILTNVCSCTAKPNLSVRQTHLAYYTNC